MNQMAKKSMKLHINNGNGSFVCGLSIKPHIPQAAWESDALWNVTNGDKIDHNNYQCICTNCMKLFHPSFLNDLLIEKELIEYKASLPKSNRERARRNQSNRRNRNKRRNQSNCNVIYLPHTPIPKKPIALIEDQQWRSLDKKAKVIKKANSKKHQLKAKHIEPETIQSIVDTEESFIQYSDGLAIVRGFGDQWMVVLQDQTNGTESLSDWINRNEAEAIINDLIAA